LSRNDNYSLNRLRNIRKSIVSGARQLYRRMGSSDAGLYRVVPLMFSRAATDDSKERTDSALQAQRSGPGRMDISAEDDPRLHARAEGSPRILDSAGTGKEHRLEQLPVHGGECMRCGRERATQRRGSRRSDSARMAGEPCDRILPVEERKQTVHVGIFVFQCPRLLEEVLAGNGEELSVAFNGV
jgi:hypothetical protein